MTPETSYAERHFRVSEIAEMLAIGRETARKLCINEPGVIRIRMGKKKAHTLLSVPASVLERICKRLTAV